MALKCNIHPRVPSKTEAQRPPAISCPCVGCLPSPPSVAPHASALLTGSLPSPSQGGCWEELSLQQGPQPTSLTPHAVTQTSVQILGCRLHPKTWDKQLCRVSEPPLPIFKMHNMTAAALWVSSKTWYVLQAVCLAWTLAYRPCSVNVSCKYYSQVMWGSFLGERATKVTRSSSGLRLCSRHLEIHNDF